ncbi:hypothetical protein, partial [Escherichia coli]|uniref:hypothetical protein n=1 Tax=Escherichia coli TaxID=562 RepID=UPI001BAF0E93
KKKKRQKIKPKFKETACGWVGVESGGKKGWIKTGGFVMGKTLGKRGKTTGLLFVCVYEQSLCIV